ncbi:MAG TPA: (Fe-S)-binding protein [Desulfomicrobiaceae bacterium]|nr:(Fe-S)-binding protein [Desulfomicrobiaceae bacterium]
MSESSPLPSASRNQNSSAKRITSECTECGACVRSCAFLSTHGSPRTLAERLAHEGPAVRDLAFDCSLCGLCSEICPLDLDPSTMFLDMRRDAASRNEVDLKRYRTILGYENRGNSSLFSHAGLPKGCDTVFFPGCTLTGTRPGVTEDLFGHLQNTIPSLGIVLECCNKPSHDLGRQDHFETMFGELRDMLLAHGVRRVLTACPNCFKVFSTYGNGLKVSTVYEHLAAHGLPATTPLSGEVTIHDPCPMRHVPGAHKALRTLAAKMGLDIHEMKHSRKRTLCCGEGGSVSFRSPELSKNFTERRAREAGDRTVLTSCAGCAHFLGRSMDTAHMLDVVFRPEAVREGKARAVKAPLTYLKRLTLKRRFKAGMPMAMVWERSGKSPLPAKTTPVPVLSWKLFRYTALGLGCLVSLKVFLFS